MELNPQVVFERMFGDGTTAEQRAARRQRDRSILDSLTGSLSRLRTRLAASDRERLDDYELRLTAGQTLVTPEMVQRLEPRIADGCPQIRMAPGVLALREGP